MTKFIAEVGSNHNGDFARACDLIGAAAESGCDAVKFQLWQVDRLYAPELRAAKQALKAQELPIEWIPKLRLYASAHGLQFGMSVFHRGDAIQVAPLVDFLKISSYSLFDTPLILEAVATGRPVYLSTGMATARELQHVPFWDVRVLFHCVSGYPTPPTQCNLAALDNLRQLSGGLVGWSDHSGSRDVLLRAALYWHASYIEAHLDLDGAGAEFGGGHCWLPDALGDVIQSVKAGAFADGVCVKEPQPCEQAELPWRADPVDGMRPLQAHRALLSTVNK